MIRFNTLLDLPRSAVFAIVDEKHKRVLVTFSTSLLASLARIVDRIKVGESFYRELSPMNELSFVVLEEELCRNRLMVRTGFYMREYKNQDYSLLVEQAPVEYRVKCIPRYQTYGGDAGVRGEFFLQATLVSKRNSRVVVGEFKKQSEYDEFIRLNYSNEIVYDIIYDKSVSEAI